MLLDVHMPEMNGLEATRTARAELAPERQPHIVALTASVLLEDREACREAGMDDHLAKPVRRPQLAAVLERVAPRGATSRTPDQQEARVPRQTDPQDAPGAVAAVPPFDTTAIDDLVRSLGDRGSALRHDLLSSYVSEGDARVAELRDGDRDVVRRVAHTMRSSSRVIGLDELSDLFERLELTAADDEAPADRVAPLAALAAVRYAAAAAGIRVVLAAPHEQVAGPGGVPA